MNYNLDANDLFILYFLKNDSRMSYSNLGKELNMTPSAIVYRVNKLIENNVINNFTININQNILTPNYVSYVMTAKINREHIKKIVEELVSFNYFDKISELASSSNLILFTQPLSNKQFKELIVYMDNDKIDSYNITPIVKDHNSHSKNIVGESINKVYCPLCQKKISGQGIVTSIKNKTFSFCCKECLQEFKKNFLNIIEK